MEHLTLTVLVVLSVIGAATPGVDSAAVADQSTTGDSRVVVGCLSTESDGFILRTVAGGDSGRRTGGSASAKASTPIGGGPSASLLGRKDTAGSNSAKASTPIGGTQDSEGRRTAGVLTPKGSTPVPRSASAPAYVLSAVGVELAPYLNQLLEVSGVARPPSPAAMQTLQVANVRWISATCGQ
jgi:hypothetical protein